MFSNREECKRCLECSDLLYKQLKTNVEDQGRYVSIIGTVFFVALITIYTSITKDLSQNARNCFIISFLISVSSFVINEMINMIRTFSEQLYCQDLWQKFYERKKSLPKIQQKANIYNNKLYKNNFTVWIICFCVSILSGSVAVITLCVSLF